MSEMRAAAAVSSRAAGCRLWADIGGNSRQPGPNAAMHPKSAVNPLYQMPSRSNSHEQDRARGHGRSHPAIALEAIGQSKFRARCCLPS